MRKLDFDQFIVPNWNQTYGDRVFQFDAFLSHRRNDESYLLRRTLEAKGLKVWRDEDSDISNRKVQQKISKSLLNSRYIVLCAGKDFWDSIWCRAEYLPALDVERWAKGERIVIAQMVDNLTIPPEFSHSPVFRIGSQDLEGLASYLRKGNRLPFDPANAITLTRMVNHRMCESLVEQCNDILRRVPNDPPDGSEEWFRLVLATEVKDQMPSGLPPDSFSYSFYGIRRWTCAPERPVLKFSSDTHHLIQRLALWYADSKDSDNRANAMHLLVWLYVHRLTADTLQHVVELLRSECTPGIIEIAVEGFSRMNEELNEKDLRVVHLAILRAGPSCKSVISHDLSLTLPEAIRIRLCVKGLKFELLSNKEQLALIHQRLEYLLQAERVSVDDGIDAFNAVMGVSDIEITMKDLHDFLLDSQWIPKDFGEEKPDIYASALAMLTQLIESSEQNKGEPLIFMDEWVCNYIIPILVLFLRENEIREPARRVCEKLDGIMEKFSRYGYEVPAYKRVFEQVELGESIEDVHRDFELDIMRLQLRNPK